MIESMIVDSSNVGCLYTNGRIAIDHENPM